MAATAEEKAISRLRAHGCVHRKCRIQFPLAQSPAHARGAERGKIHSMSQGSCAHGEGAALRPLGSRVTRPYARGEGWSTVPMTKSASHQAARVEKSSNPHAYADSCSTVYFSIVPSSLLHISSAIICANLISRSVCFASETARPAS